MTRDPKMLFAFEVTYFKPSGKWYTTTEYEWECARLAGNPAHPYMNDFVAHIRGLRDSGSSLPGLTPGRWDGFIMVRWGDSFPTLILPPKENEDE